MEIFVKNPEPVRYNLHADDEKAKRLGAKRWEQIKDDIGPGRAFETEAQKNDYMRRVRSNPNNVLGIPTFYEKENAWATDGSFAVVICECGELNAWGIDTGAAWSMKACVKCQKMLEWNKTKEKIHD